MRLKSVFKLLNIPFAVIGGKDEIIVSSSMFDNVFPSLSAISNILSGYGEETISKGIVVEKSVFVGEEKKTFSVFIQKSGDFIVVLGIDISYSSELINSLVEDGGMLGAFFGSVPIGFYSRRLDGKFIFKNDQFCNTEKFISYPDDYLIENVLKNEEVADFRIFESDGEKYFVFECAKLVDYEGEDAIAGAVFLDKGELGSGSLLRKTKILEKVAYYSKRGVMFFEGKDLILTFKNKSAETMLPGSYFTMLRQRGLFEENLLFDSLTLTYLKNAIYSYGECELLNYKIPHIDGEFDFEFIAGTNDIAVFFNKVVPKTEKEAYRQFRSMFEFASDAIFLMKDFVFVECNKKAEELFKCRKDGIVGKTPIDFSPDFQDEGIPSEEAAFKMVDTASQKGNQVFEWIHKKCDGTLFNAEVTLSRFQIRGYTYTMAIVRDISSRKNLMEAGRCFLEVLSGKNGVCVFDEKFNVLFGNEFGFEVDFEKIKEVVMSLIAEGNALFGGNYRGDVSINGVDFKIEIKILEFEFKKFFAVKLEKIVK